MGQFIAETSSHTRGRARRKQKSARHSSHIASGEAGSFVRMRQAAPLPIRPAHTSTRPTSQQTTDVTNPSSPDRSQPAGQSPSLCVAVRPGGWAVPIVLSVLLLNIGMLFGTWLFNAYYWSLPQGWDSGGKIKYFLIQFDLGRENVLAAWYSSMLLLLVGVMAALCLVIDRSRPGSTWDRRLSYGWLGVTAIFWMLSLDELGSVHERFLWFRYVIAASCLYLLVFGCVRLRRCPGALVLFLLGIGSFLSVPFQEEIEVGLWSTVGMAANWHRPILHLLLEEGTELFGMFLFLAATVFYASKAARGASSDPSVQDPAIEVHFTSRTAWTVLAGLLGLLGLTLAIVRWTMYPVPKDNGFAANWAPSVLAALSCLYFLCVHDSVQVEQSRTRLTYLAATLLSLAYSAYFGTPLDYFAHELGGEVWLALRSLLIGGTVVTAVWLIRQVDGGWARIGTIGWVILTLWAISDEGNRVLPGFLAFALLLLSFPADWRRRLSPPMVQE